MVFGECGVVPRVLGVVGIGSGYLNGLTPPQHAPLQVAASSLNQQPDPHR